MPYVAMDVGYSDLVNNGCSEATEDDGQSFGADAISVSPLLELQVRSKSPLAMIASPIMENWDSAVLEQSSRGKIAAHSLTEDEESGYALDEDDMQFGTESVTSEESQPSRPLSRARSGSPETTLGFKSLSPPPWHFRARRQNAWRYADLNVAADKDEQGDIPSDVQSIFQHFDQPALSY